MSDDGILEVFMLCFFLGGERGVGAMVLCVEWLILISSVVVEMGHEKVVELNK